MHLFLLLVTIRVHFQSSWKLIAFLEMHNSTDPNKQIYIYIHANNLNSQF